MRRPENGDDGTPWASSGSHYVLAPVRDGASGIEGDRVTLVTGQVPSGYDRVTVECGTGEVVEATILDSGPNGNARFFVTPVPHRVTRIVATKGAGRYGVFLDVALSERIGPDPRETVRDRYEAPAEGIRTRSSGPDRTNLPGSLAPEEVEQLADELRSQLQRVVADELGPSTTMRERLEGAIAVIDVVQGRSVARDDVVDPTVMRERIEGAIAALDVVEGRSSQLAFDPRSA